MFLIITIVVSRNSKRTGDLPQMPLNLKRFDEPVAMVELESSDFKNIDYFNSYQNVMRGYQISNSSNITEDMLSLVSSHHNLLNIFLNSHLFCRHVKYQILLEEGILLELLSI